MGTLPTHLGGSWTRACIPELINSQWSCLLDPVWQVCQERPGFCRHVEMNIVRLLLAVDHQFLRGRTCPQVSCPPKHCSQQTSCWCSITQPLPRPGSPVGHHQGRAAGVRRKHYYQHCVNLPYVGLPGVYSYLNLFGKVFTWLFYDISCTISKIPGLQWR